MGGDRFYSAHGGADGAVDGFGAVVVDYGGLNAAMRSSAWIISGVSGAGAAMCRVSLRAWRVIFPAISKSRARSFFRSHRRALL